MWDPTPVGALSHGSSSDGNDPLPRHVSRVAMIGMADLALCSRTITLLWGKSDDMKSDVVIEEIV